MTRSPKTRSEYPLKTKDFFIILEQLFATKERDLVHIGIDFYLAFQSGQRIFSDQKNIISGVRQLLEERAINPSACVLEMIVQKTERIIRSKSKFILSEQLCRLLE